MSLATFSNAIKKKEVSKEFVLQGKTNTEMKSNDRKKEIDQKQPRKQRSRTCVTQELAPTRSLKKWSVTAPSVEQNILVPQRPHQSVSTDRITSGRWKEMGQYLTKQQQQQQGPQSIMRRMKRPRPASFTEENNNINQTTGTATSTYAIFSSHKSNKSDPKIMHSPPLKVTCRRPLARNVNNISHSRKIITHIPENQMATRNHSYAADIIRSSSLSSSSTSYKFAMKSATITRSTTVPQKRNKDKHFQQPKRASFRNILLKARVYTPLSVLRSQIPGDMHLGSWCEPVVETMVVKRDASVLEKWCNLESVPKYFQRTEADANISGGYDSVYSFLRRAASIGLLRPIQRVIEKYEEICKTCEMVISRSNAHEHNQSKWGRVTLANNRWPVGYDGSRHRPRSCVDTSPFERYKELSNSRLDIMYLAKYVFKLPADSCERIRTKDTTLLFEVSSFCEKWRKERDNIRRPSHVPEAYFPYTIFISPEERFLEVKLGIYYMLESGKVIKFMTRPESLTDFVLECMFGFGIQGKLKGAVGVLNVCPEGFCLEMEFAGMSLQDVLNGDLNCILNRPPPPPLPNQRPSTDKPEVIQHHMSPSRLQGILYSVRMLQVTGCLPEQLKKKCTFPITDSHAAVGVANVMRDRFLDQLPFALTEVINIVTRLSQQGLVNPDIKADNIVIDGSSGQPKMIDFGLMLPAGKYDEFKRTHCCPDNVYNVYPQTAPEYLQGRVCSEAAMTYGLSYLISFVLSTLSSRTTDFAVASMKTNIKLSYILGQAYDKDDSKRPRAYNLAQVIGACFPFKEKIAKLFLYPKHSMS